MNFKKEVIDASHHDPIVVQFSGATCPPCQVMKPILNALSIERRDFKLVIIDAWKERELSMEYNVKAVPDVLLFINGQVISKYPPILNKDRVSQWLDKNIQNITEKLPFK